VHKEKEREEIEVTPDMIEAGFKILADSGIADDPLEADKLFVSEIYRAMRVAYLRERLIPLTQVRLYIVSAEFGIERSSCEDCLA
jgi:hypothetical protein